MPWFNLLKKKGRFKKRGQWFRVQGSKADEYLKKVNFHPWGGD
jgi:hypothetical protein